MAMCILLQKLSASAFLRCEITSTRDSASACRSGLKSRFSVSPFVVEVGGDCVCVCVAIMFLGALEESNSNHNVHPLRYRYAYHAKRKP